MKELTREQKEQQERCFRWNGYYNPYVDCKTYGISRCPMTCSYALKEKSLEKKIEIKIQ